MALIHVFHQNEDFQWLEKMVKEMGYIGLSPANDRTTNEKQSWLDRCMDFVLDKNGIPKVKFHGFAVTSLRLMLRYSWYSVDSTSWVLTGRFGSVYVPKIKSKREYVYGENSWKICVSNKSPSQKDQDKHITTFPEIQREEIKKYFKIKGYELGKSEFKIEKKDYKLKENEKWFSKAKKDGTREVEKII